MWRTEDRQNKKRSLKYMGQSIEVLNWNVAAHQSTDNEEDAERDDPARAKYSA